MTKPEFWQLRVNDRVRLNTPNSYPGVVRSVVECCGVLAAFVEWDSGKVEVYDSYDSDLIQRAEPSPETAADGTDGRAALVWPFRDAPQGYRALSPHGGDEDWVAFIPHGFRGDPTFMGQETDFGRCNVSEHPVAGGTVRIGAHA